MARTMLPVSGLRVQGETMQPFYRPKGNGLRDIREVSGQSFVSLFCGSGESVYLVSADAALSAAFPPLGTLADPTAG